MQQAKSLFSVGGNTRLVPPKLSAFSTPAVANSGWSSFDFMLGAGMVVIQQNTHKIVVVYETRRKYWFFPRGRKDIGESLEQTALRETYEESGYRAEFLPLVNPTHQPQAPGQSDSDIILNKEPMYISLTSWKPRLSRDGLVEDSGGEYLTTWYAGQIAEDATHESGTGMPDEQDYQTHLLDYEDAVSKLHSVELLVLRYVWDIYCQTDDYLREVAAQNPGEPRKNDDDNEEELDSAPTASSIPI